jgi:hypothetical protein
MDEKLVVQITAEIADLKKQIANAKGEVEGFAKDAESSSAKIDETFKNAGTSIKNGMKVAAVGVAGAVTALVALGPATEEYRRNQSMLATAFETAGGSAEMAKETYNDLYRVLGDSGQATEAAQQLGKLTTEQAALTEYTDILQGVYATFGESLPLEGLAEALNHTTKLGEVQGSLADALEWSGVNVDEFNEKLATFTTESEREAFIRETLNGLYSEASAAYEQNAADILAANEAQARLDEALAATGEVMAPVMTMLKELGADVLTALQPHIQSFAENYLPKIKNVLGEVGTKLSETITWIKEHKTILAVMAGIIGGIATAIGLYNAVAAVKAAMDAAQVATLGALIAAQIAHAAAAALALAPYALVVAAIAAVIAIIVLCIKHWDDIKAAVVNVAKKIGETVSTTFGNIKDTISEKITSAKTAVLNTFDNIKNGIKQKLDSAKATVKNVIDAIKGFFNFKFTWPKIPMPKFSISPSGWKVGDLLKGSIPRLSIRWNAKGGVFDDPTLFFGNGGLQGLGENGAEAVVPLEKNTEWLDKIAEKLAGKQSSGPIYLQVDGKTFAQIACDNINQLTRQRGSIPLNMY